MKNIIFIICLFFIACYNGQVMKKEACINFVKHEELGKYPFEKSIKYTLQIDNQNVPVYCYAHVFKGNIVSLELSRTPEKIKNMSSGIMLSFFAKVLGSFNEKEKSKITQVYTKREYWEEESTKLSHRYFNNTLPIKTVLEESDLLKDIRSILKENNLYVDSFDCDLITTNKTHIQSDVLLCGDFFLSVKLLE